MDKLLTLSYYFNTRPDPNFQFTKFTLALALIFLVGGVAFEYWRKKKLTDKIARKLLRPYSGKLIRWGALVLFLLACREYGIPYFSMRLWWLILFAWIAYQLIRLAVTYKKEYAARLKMTKKTAKVDKYLPKRKKK